MDYKNLIEKNIADTQYEIKKVENNLTEMYIEEQELNIELDKLKGNIDKKDKEI